MNKDDLSFADVERLFEELAEFDRQAALDDAQTELMRAAARQEFRRIIIRRRCFRMAGGVAALAIMGGSLSLLTDGADEPAHELAVASAPPTSSPVRYTSDLPLLKEEMPHDFNTETILSYEGVSGTQFSAGESGSYDVNPCIFSF